MAQSSFEGLLSQSPLNVGPPIWPGSEYGSSGSCRNWTELNWNGNPSSSRNAKYRNRKIYRRRQRVLPSGSTLPNEMWWIVRNLEGRHICMSRENRHPLATPHHSLLFLRLPAFPENGKLSVWSSSRQKLCGTHISLICDWYADSELSSCWENPPPHPQSQQCVCA